MPRTGKYAAVIDKLPKYVGDDPGYEAKVFATTQVIQEKQPDDYQPMSREEVEEALVQIRSMVTFLNEQLLHVTKGKEHGVEYAKAYRLMRLVDDAINEAQSEVNLIKAAYEKLIDKYYEVEGVTSLRLDTGESVSVQYEPHLKVTNPNVFRKWCIEAGLEEKLQLPWQSGNSLAKERLLEGLPEPDGTELRSKPKFVLRKG